MVDLREYWLKYRTSILLGGGSISAIIIVISLLIYSATPSEPIIFSSETSHMDSPLSQRSDGSSQNGGGVIKVDVEGAVDRPGLYDLPFGARVEDAIIAAGGLTMEADSETFGKVMNRAMKLVDGGKIFVPKINENVTSDSKTSHIINQIDEGKSQNGLISINYASQSELESLPGVGPVTASKIIANRPYQTLEELVTKKTVGQSVFQKIKDLIAL